MTTQWQSSTLRVCALRLEPGMDLRAQLQQFTLARNITAGFIVTCVGSLALASLRLADGTAASTFEGKFEIISLVGTLSADGPHLHIALADSKGLVIGGHLLDGSLVYTTAEIVIGEAEELRFRRTIDSTTGFKELRIESGRSQP
jgi:predicted DNA-binding protein with PD1-like motif